MVTELGRESAGKVELSWTIRYRPFKISVLHYVLVVNRILILRINSSLLKRNKREQIVSFN